MQTRTLAMLMCGLMWMPLVHADDKPASNETASAQPTRKLDLRLPDIRSIFSQETIDRVLARTHDRENIAEVEVERIRDRIAPRSPAVSSGIFAPFWAFAHPADAWRIFAPIPPDRAILLASAPDATDLNRAASQPRGIAIGD